MRNYLAVFKKEWREGARTFRLLILLLVFLALGIMSPLTAKLTPDLLQAFVPDLAAAFPTPTALDAWAQFFKNVSQLGLIVLVVVLSGTLSAEVYRGTLVILLTKGLSRSAVILAKYSYMVLLWTLSLAICLLVCWGYTYYLFPGPPPSLLWFSVFCLWAFGVFLLAVLMLAAAWLTRTISCLLLTGGVVVGLLLLSIVPPTAKYNPLSLLSLNMNLLVGTTLPGDLYWALAVAGGATLFCLVTAVLIFRKKRL